MKQTDFAVSLQKFFMEHLFHRRGNRENTIKSYRDAFKLFLKYMLEIKSIVPDKIQLTHFTSDEIGEFCKYLQKSRKNSDRTRNLRLAALRSFATFLEYEHPEKLLQWQKIRSMPFRRCEESPVSYLTQDELATLLSSVCTDGRYGLRNYAMLLLLYDSGARVQEIVDLSVRDIRLEKPSQVVLHGKGGKSRIVPITSDTVAAVKQYMIRFGLSEKSGELPLFCNSRGRRISRFGITYILDTCSSKVKIQKPMFRKKVSPHLLRHSKAMHLLEEGCSLIIIQKFLGHSDLKTTTTYAKANQEMIRSALEKANKKNASIPEFCSWQEDKGILDMLNKF